MTLYVPRLVVTRSFSFFFLFCSSPHKPSPDVHIGPTHILASTAPSDNTTPPPSTVQADPYLSRHVPVTDGDLGWIMFVRGRWGKPWGTAVYAWRAQQQWHIAGLFLFLCPVRANSSPS